MAAIVAERYTGASIKRSEDPRILTGAGRYVDDVKLPGMLHAAFVRSPLAHARVASVDVSAARERGQKLAADQVTAENEEEIDADPAEAIDAAGRFESEERGVIDGDDDDGQRAEKIEARLALTMCETRVDFGR